MINHYPLWKNLLIASVVVIGVLFALPNLYGTEPVVQVSPTGGDVITDDTRLQVENLLNSASLPYNKIEISGKALIIYFKEAGDQLQAQGVISQGLGYNYVVALNLKPATPDWLKAFNAKPMYLGLDLRGGVHLLIEVDIDSALAQAEERYVGDLRTTLREEKVRYQSIGRPVLGGVEARFKDEESLAAAVDIIGKDFPELERKEVVRDGKFLLKLAIGKAESRDIKNFAVEQNIITLRKRVDELGVAEPVIQRQGVNRIVIQLPGIQDPARAKEILGTTATLEFRLVDNEHNAHDAVAQNRAPAGSRLYKRRDGSPVLLKKRIIVTGDQIIDAASGIEQQSGTPAVFITLDSKGARKMNETTRSNIGGDMAVVFMENKIQTRIVNGERIRTSKKISEVISVATIRSQFSKRFQISGIDSFDEARNLALLLRAGALAAPIEIIEERTVGPSLGQDNINQGFMSVMIGFILVLIFMVVWYRLFGLIANLALFVNLVLIIAVLSLLQATLTLPGIAGIVLTVGMAVDANVLVFERIREELRNGNSPQASINAGYSKAMSTIADANITTLIAAIVLYSFGTGAIKGFAITLSIGIMTSMFTAILGTRAVANLIYGGRKSRPLSI